MPKNDKNNSKFAIVSMEVLQHPKLSSTAKVLFAMISVLSSKNNGCYASNEYLAKELNFSVPTVQKKLVELEQFSIISRSKNGNGKRFLYISNGYIAKGYQKVSAGVSKMIRGGIKNDQSVKHKYDFNIKDMSVCTFESQFEHYWEKYPRKDGKKEALRHFKASVKTEKDLLSFGKSLDNYLLYLRRRRTPAKYIKGGGTWFNNWKDWTDWKDPIILEHKGDDALSKMQKELAQNVTAASQSTG
jgi:predicted transcriptional regulator